MPYSFLPHTADMRMGVSGETLEELFHDALLGMISAMKPEAKDMAENVQREIAIEARDATALLVDFLNEALSRMTTEREAYTEANFEKLTERSLKAVLRGYKTRSFGEDIKAATFHEADVKRGANGVWSTNIIFDV